MIQPLIISLLFISCQGNSRQIDNSQVVGYQKKTETVQSDSLLAGIQAKITNAFVLGMVSQKNDELNRVSKGLEQLYTTKNLPLILYWRSYLQFFSSIYYLEKGDKAAAEKEVEKGIDWIISIKKKNSEDYALLSMMKGFGIQFKPMKAMFTGPDAQKNAKTAIAMDSTNLRAYYVYATNDFYTPEMFGGGKETEKYLLKALSLPVQRFKNDYLPSWGKEDAYELLIRYYIRKEEWSLAKKNFQEGIEEFPDSYTINKIAPKLVGK
jgi:hypothetical protein